MLHAAEQERPDVAERRARCRAEVMPRPTPAKVVFIDETAAKTNTARTHGYAPKGGAAGGPRPARAPAHHLRRAISTRGLIAPVVVDGAVTGDLFVAYVERVPAPELRRGDVVVVDNLQCHQAGGVRTAS